MKYIFLCNGYSELTISTG